MTSLSPRSLPSWLLWVGAAVVALLVAFAAALWALHAWVHTDDFKSRVEREASGFLGVPVTLSAIDVAAFPWPSVRLVDARALTPQPVVLGEVRVRPDWRSALVGEVAIESLSIHRAQLPEAGVDALLAAMRRLAQTPARTASGGQGGSAGRWLPRRLRLDEVTWISETGRSTTVDLEAELSPDGLPRTLSLDVTAGAFQGATASLAPGENGARWQFKAQIGGGTLEGPIRLTMPTVAPAAPRTDSGAAGAAQADPALDIRVEGEIRTRGVQVAALTAPARPLTGRLTADTKFAARASGLAALIERLSTDTRFSVAEGELTGLDLLKAVETAGITRSGQTRLDALTGRMTTQGRSARVTELDAKAGALSLRGEVSISAQRALTGRVTVNLARGATGGLVAVPVNVGGTLAQPEVSLSRGALLGAAIGTAVLPGVGTGAGARLGEGIGNTLKGLFGKK